METMMDKTKKHYSEAEKDEFKKLVHVEKGIIYSAKSDDINMKLKKDAAWQRILHKYNSKTKNQRTVKQLKKLWDNLKTGHKKQLSNKKTEIMRTGGGVPAKKKIDEDAEMELAMQAFIDIEQVDAVDSDTIVLMCGLHTSSMPQLPPTDSSSVPHMSPTHSQTHPVTTPIQKTRTATQTTVPSSSRNNFNAMEDLLREEDEIRNLEAEGTGEIRSLEDEGTGGENVQNGINKRKKPKNNTSAFVQLCDVQKNNSNDEYQLKKDWFESKKALKKDALNEKTLAYRAKKEYYLLKKKMLSKSSTVSS